jgi:hypothetical protein
MARTDMNLDVDAPDRVPKVLRRAAEAFFESAGELDAAWQDKSGDIWAKIAQVLESAAVKIERML